MIMTSKIKISMSHTSNSGVSESKKLLASYTSKTAILTSKKQPHTRKMRTSHTAFLKENPPKIETENWCQLRKFYISLKKIKLKIAVDFLKVMCGVESDLSQFLYISACFKPVLIYPYTPKRHRKVQ